MRTAPVITTACAMLFGPIATPAHAAPPRFTRAQMESRLAEATWLFVYGTGDPAAVPALREQTLRIARRLFEQDSTRVRADREVGEADLAANSLVLLGGPRENAVTAKIAGELPVRFQSGGFTWQGTRYDHADDAIHLVYPNPLAPQRFVLLVAANSPAALSGRGGFWFGDADWRIYRGGELVRTGTFAQSTRAPWAYDPALDRDRERERQRFAAGLETRDRHGVRVHAARGVDVSGVLAAGAEVALARMDAMGFADPRGRVIDLTLYTSLESKGEITRITRPEHVDASGATHAALVFGRTRLDHRAVAAARLERLGADPDGRWLDAAAAWLAGRSGGETLERALARLYFGRLLPGADELAATDAAEWRSPLIWTPARALFVRAVYEAGGARGPAAVRSLLHGDTPAKLDALCERLRVPAARVRARYAALADSLARIGRAETPALRPTAWRPADGFQRGVCVAHAVSMERGYLSASCAKELATLEAMGAGWISLTPFGYLRSLHTPEIRPGWDAGANEETDEAIIEAGAHARALGLRVWLKPHLWTRGWIGELTFTPTGWATFFERYREFTLHYALLAEREGYDGLVIGHELVTASIGHPDRWRALIGDVRRVYDGTLTYGANWGEEVQGIKFWDALDVVGVSLYQPLSDTPTRSVAKLKAGAEKALAGLKAVGDRAGKPVLLTEVGYAPMDEAPVRPWEERRGAPDLETQRACYEALVGALEGKPWVAGAFFWKWFSSDDIGGPADASFTPKGKPAEAVMRKAFQAWGKRGVKERE